jgi:hypothetical protein
MTFIRALDIIQFFFSLADRALRRVLLSTVKTSVL